MPQYVIELAGYLGLIFTIGTAIQLGKMWIGRTAEGVSISTWFLFGVGNLGFYVYTQKYTSIQSVVGQLVTAVLDALIVLYAIWLRRKAKTRS